MERQKRMLNQRVMHVFEAGQLVATRTQHVSASSVRAALTELGLLREDKGRQWIGDSLGAEGLNLHTYKHERRQCYDWPSGGLSRSLIERHYRIPDNWDWSQFPWLVPAQPGASHPGQTTPRPPVSTTPPVIVPTLPPSTSGSGDLLGSEPDLGRDDLLGKPEPGGPKPSQQSGPATDDAVHRPAPPPEQPSSARHTNMTSGAGAPLEPDYHLPRGIPIFVPDRGLRPGDLVEDFDGDGLLDWLADSNAPPVFVPREPTPEASAEAEAGLDAWLDDPDSATKLHAWLEALRKRDAGDGKNSLRVPQSSARPPDGGSSPEPSPVVTHPEGGPGEDCELDAFLDSLSDPH